MICDLAETYGIFDYKSHPVERVAIFVMGLKSDSRLMKKITGINYTTDQLISAIIADNTSFLVWAKTKDGQNNRKRPKSIVEQILNQGVEKVKSETYSTGKDFEKARESILKNLEKGGKS